MNRRRWKLLLPYLILLWLFGILIVGAKALSLTLDEPIHIAVGYAIWARGKEAFWILPSHGHPPLLNLLEAALIYLENPSIPLEQLNGWAHEITDFMPAFYPYLKPLEHAEFLARIPIIWLTLLLAAVIYRWGKELGGFNTGLIALIALSFDPLLIAHGRLATTDVGTVMFGTASLYISWQWMKAPSPSKAAALGILLGLTMLSKGSGSLWAGAVAPLILWKIIQTPQKRVQWLLQGITAGTLGLLILWIGYGCTLGPVANLPGIYPAPTHWTGLLSQARSADERWVFALGLRKHGHWWWYFPLAFLLKNPLPLLLSCIIGGIVVLRKRLPFNALLPLFVFPLLYATTSITAGMNIGYRHMLPIHPTMYLLAGYGSSYLQRGSYQKLRRVVLSAMGLWYVLGTLSISPYEIAYFNELIGGPKNAHHYLVDSNLDWGQGYKALARYLEAHPGPIPKIAPRFTYIQPEDYGISSTPLPPAENASALQAPFHPLPGRYVISLTTLQQGWPNDNEIYAWFRQVAPTAELGYSFFLYDIALPPLTWLGQCDVPATPLNTDLITWGFGQMHLRLFNFDCFSAWLYPSGGVESGAYGLHHEIVPQQTSAFPSLLPTSPQAKDPFIARRLTGQRLSLNMRQYTESHPAFVLYEQAQISGLPSNQTIIALPTNESHTTPLVLDGPLTFLGAQAYFEGEDLSVETWWQITDGPITRPLSIMGHLLTSTGAVLEVADGLGVSPMFWQPGDILVQRHRFTRPTDETGLWLRTGIYWLDTMERWPLVYTPDANMFMIQLEK